MILYSNNNWADQIQHWAERAKKIYDLFGYEWFDGPPSIDRISSTVLMLLNRAVSDPTTKTVSTGRIHVVVLKSELSSFVEGYEVTFDV